MPQKKLKISLVLFLTVFLCGVGQVIAGTMLSEVRDVISTSAPEEFADHEVSFDTPVGVPAGGEIEFELEEGVFLITDGFDHSNVELYVRPPESDDFGERTLGEELDLTEGVSGVDIQSGDQGKVVTTLSDQILSDSRVKLRFFTIHDPEENEYYGIQNPSEIDSYKIHLKVRDDAGEQIAQATTMIATVEPVGVRAWPKPDPDEEEDWGDDEDGEEDDDEEETDPPEDEGDSTDDGESESGSGDPGGGSGGGGGGGSGGGSGDPYPPDTGSVAIEGKAYTGSQVFVLVDGNTASEERLSSSEFVMRLDELDHGSYNFGVYAVDANGDRSPTESISITVRSDTVNRISEVLIPPTLAQDGDSVDPGEDLELSGYSPSDGELELQILRGEDVIEETSLQPETNGSWSHVIDTSDMSQGEYTARARYHLKDDSNRSDWNKIVFGVGVEPDVETGLTADLNKDNKVNLADFSILLFHWGTSESVADINSDATVGLADFSIMLFQWTG